MARRPRWPAATNTFELAASRAARLDPQQVSQLMDVLAQQVDALRRGEATETDLSRVRGSCLLSRFIQDQGVVRVVDNDTIDRACAAADAIHGRAWADSTWRTPTLYAAEITALTDLLVIHRFQLENLSWGEFRAALDSAKGYISNSPGETRLSRMMT